MNRRGFLKKLAIAGLTAIFAASALPASSQQVNPYAGNTTVQNNLYKHPSLASSSTKPVGVQLVLAMDTSGSMTDEEYSIEMQAAAYALNSELFRNAIKYKAGPEGANSVAICLLDFASTAMLRVPWVDIRGEEINDKPYDPAHPEKSSAKPDKLDLLTQEIANLPRIRSGGTTIEWAQYLAGNLFLVAPWKPIEKRVLDLFGDGSSGIATVQANRNNLINLGVTSNAFAIINEEPDLDIYFRENFVSQEQVESPDGIWSDYGRVWAVARNMQAQNNNLLTLRPFFETVAQGMEQKISIEVAGEEQYYRTLEKLGFDRSQIPPVPERVRPALNPEKLNRKIGPN